LEPKAKGSMAAFEQLQYQLLENHLPTCDDKTNKALLDNDVINKDKLPEAFFFIWT
jgi:hypothetical protein